MSGFSSGQGTAGSSFSHYNYPGIYQDQDFHGCRHGINDWNSKYEIQNCELAGLAEYVHTSGRESEMGLLISNVAALPPKLTTSEAVWPLTPTTC